MNKVIKSLLKYSEAGLFFALLLACYHIASQSAEISELKAAQTESTAAQYALHKERTELATWIMEKNRDIPQIVALQWADSMQRAAATYGVPLDVFRKLSIVESGTAQITPKGWNMRRFYKCSNEGQPLTSCAGAVGIYQVMPFWAKQCPEARHSRDLREPAINIYCGAYVLSHYLKQYKSMEYALTAYNGGPRAVNLLLQGRDITNGYAKKVLGQVI